MSALLPCRFNQNNLAWPEFHWSKNRTKFAAWNFEILFFSRYISHHTRFLSKNVNQSNGVHTLWRYHVFIRMMKPCCCWQTTSGIFCYVQSLIAIVLLFFHKKKFTFRFSQWKYFAINLALGQGWVLCMPIMSAHTARGLVRQISIYILPVVHSGVGNQFVSHVQHNLKPRLCPPPLLCIMDRAKCSVCEGKAKTNINWLPGSLFWDDLFGCWLEYCFGSSSYVLFPLAVVSSVRYGHDVWWSVVVGKGGHTLAKWAHSFLVKSAST